MKRFISSFFLFIILISPTTIEEYKENGVFVLLYHSFLGTNKYPTDISISELRLEIDTLKKKGYRFVEFSDIVNRRIKGINNIMVTVDDGNRTFYTAYKEVFKPEGIKPLLAIYPHAISFAHYALTWGELLEISRDGCEIASHGYYHLIMNQKLYDTDRKDFMSEIFDSKAILEKKLNRPITVFVYPFGVRLGLTKMLLKKAGYSYAFNLDWGVVNVPAELNDPYDLPRYMFTQESKNAVFAQIDRLSRTVPNVISLQ